MSKARIEDLAVLGGPREFSDPLHVGRPNLGDETAFFDRLRDLLTRRWLTNDGPYALEFEQKVGEALGADHCIATCNGTAALEIAIRALGLSGEVVVPSFTFVATVHALEWLGITPVFCDVDPDTHMIDARAAERLISPKTTAILAVHLWGGTCDVDDLVAVAARHGIKLLFDAAHAFGCDRGGRPVASFGDASVFSFHATKVVHSFEGGAVTTNSAALAKTLRAMKNFGFVDYDDVRSVGINAKLSEPAAAMGLVSLEHFEDFRAANHRNHTRYQSALVGLPGVSLVTHATADRTNYHYVVLEIDESRSGLTRDQLQRVLWAENVLARRYFYPGCHRMEPYSSRDPFVGSRLPCTERLAARVLCLPTGTAVSEADVDRTCAIIRLSIRHGAELARRLS